MTMTCLSLSRSRRAPLSFLLAGSLLGWGCSNSSNGSPDGATDGAAVVVDTAVARDMGPDATVLPPGALGPRPYLQKSDSPFSGVDFSYFHIEDFEDHKLDTPGVSASASQLSSTFGASLIDSVDGDDGIPNDDKCVKVAPATCDALWGAGTIKFTFDATVLGALPTHAGVVWTDGEGTVSFEAFGPDGKSIYKVGPVSEPGFPDSTVNSSTKEDRFFGAVSPTGISAIVISNTAGGVEADHLQYGRQR